MSFGWQKGQRLSLVQEVAHLGMSRELTGSVYISPEHSDQDSCLHERDIVFATIYSVVICNVRLEDSCLQERDMVFATIL